MEAVVHEAGPVLFFLSPTEFRDLSTVLGPIWRMGGAQEQSGLKVWLRQGGLAVTVVAIGVMLAVLSQEEPSFLEGPGSPSNLPVGPHFWTNRNGHKLYARAWLPSSPAATKGVFAFVHGYSGHINGRSHFATSLAAQGFAVVGYDMQGHGYSEGEHVYIETYESLVEDQLEFLATLLHSGSQKALGKSQPGLVGLVPDGFDLSRAPLFVAGESMGGALALLIAQRLSSAADDARHPSAGRFRGAILCAPAIYGNLPPAPVVFFLKHFAVPLLPRTRMPAFLESVNFPELIWATEERRRNAAADQWGRPGGIGWGHTMRLGSAGALLQMTLDTQALLPAVAFPFLVLHDPEDGIIPFVGSQQLIAQSASSDKRLVEIPDGLHDLITNAHERMVAAIVSWAAPRV